MQCRIIKSAWWIEQNEIIKSPVAQRNNFVFRIWRSLVQFSPASDFFSCVVFLWQIGLTVVFASLHFVLFVNDDQKIMRNAMQNDQVTKLSSKSNVCASKGTSVFGNFEKGYNICDIWPKSRGKVGYQTSWRGVTMGYGRAKKVNFRQILHI